MLIKIKVPGEVTIADQPPTNRGPKGDNRGRVLFYTIPFCTEKKCIVHHSSIHTNIYRSHTPVQRSIQTEWHAGATCRKWARDMAWASGYIEGFLNRLTIADQSRTNRGFFDQLETRSTKKYIADAVSDLGV